MLTIKKIAVRIFLIFGLVWLSGCESDNPVGDGNKITGTVYDEKGFPCGGSIVNLENHQPYYLTLSDGKFSLNVKSPPYNLKINNKVIYKGIILNNINLLSNRFAEMNRKTISVKIPKILKKNEIGFLKFLSNDISYSGYGFTFGGTVPLTIEYPITKTAIEGKIVLLSVIFNSNYFITSYEHFGVKNVRLDINSLNDTISFSESEINYNPPECEITFDVTNENSENSTTLFSLNFKEYKSISFIPLNNFLNKGSFNSFKFIEPALLSEPFDFRISFIQTLRDSNNKFSYFRNEKTLNLDPCTGGNIIIHNKIFSQHPENNQTDVNRHTNFIFENNGPNGIYEFNIEEYFGKGIQLVARVYTDKNWINFGELIDSGLELHSHSYFSWHVIKHLGYNSIDEFVETPFYEISNTKGTLSSAYRNFFTGSLK